MLKRNALNASRTNTEENFSLFQFKNENLKL